MEVDRVRDIMWRPIDGIGLEACNFGLFHLADREPKDWITFSGISLGVHEGKSFDIQYGFDFNTLKPETGFHFATSGAGQEAYNSNVYITDGTGKWWNHRGNSVPKFDDCLVIHLAQTPATATYALYRLNLSSGQTGQITVMAIDMLKASFTPEIHSYTCLERTQFGGTYSCESLSSGVKTTFTVDADNLVIDYGEKFRRVWTNTEQV
ncbi:MAG: putative glycolipid-binding domain-containing protein [Chloroflexota bacterium]